MAVLVLEYSRVLAEVDVVLNHFPQKLLEKVPSNLINSIKENKNKNYVFKYDEDKSLVEQKISEDAKNLISAIYFRYICDDEKKSQLIEIFKVNELKKNDEKIKNNNLNSIIYEKKEIEVENKRVEKSESIVEVKDKWYKKIINKIKGLFKIK